MSDPFIKASNGLLDWYWTYGKQRTGQFALGLDTWLDRAGQTRTTLACIDSTEQSQKPCMAVWGPSQSGKSTLISSYVDAGGNDLGVGTSLHWPGGVPARFVASSQTAGAVVLNPVHIGIDASGCVSRFVLKDAVPDADHPVEVRLATEAQIMHALAMGYLSECVVADAQGQRVYFTPELFRKRVEELGRPQGASPVPTQKAFDDLHRFVELLEVLIHSELPRYENLKSDWLILRRELLSNSVLSSNGTTVQSFASLILWDGIKPLSELFQNFVDFRERLFKHIAGKPLRCSLKVASALLDIQGCKQIRDADQPGATPSDSKFKSLAFSIGLSSTTDSVQLKESGSHPLVSNLVEFGLLQGLVWELIIPLRQETLQVQAPVFCEFLQAADLLDFPGVKQGDSAVQAALLDLNHLEKFDNFKLFADVFKRGKTASIVMDYAKGLGIDGFSLLTRIDRFPSQPGQLATGIQTWWKNLAPDFDPHGTKQRSPLPLNLVLTFCGITVTQAMAAGVPATFPPVFERIGKLHVLSSPDVVTTFATTYPQFPGGELSFGGKVVDADHVELLKIEQVILEEPSFKRQFHLPTSVEAFSHMLRNGGTGYFISQLGLQARQSQRPQLVARRLAVCKQILLDLLQEALPGDAGFAEQRKKDISAWRDAIINRLSAMDDPDQLVQVSFSLRRVLSVDATALDPIPPNLTAKVGGKVALTYIQKQFQNWINAKTTEASTQIVIDSCFQDLTHMSRTLRHLIDGINLDPTAFWLMDRVASASVRRGWVL